MGVGECDRAGESRSRGDPAGVMSGLLAAMRRPYFKWWGLARPEVRGPMLRLRLHPYDAVSLLFFVQPLDDELLEKRLIARVPPPGQLTSALQCALLESERDGPCAW